MIRINGEAFDPTPQDAQAIAELNAFHAQLSARAAPFFTTDGRSLWHYIGYFVYANFRFPRWPGLTMTLALVRRLVELRGAREIIVEYDDRWGESAAEHLARLAGVVVTVRRRRTGRVRARVEDSPLLIRSLIRARTWTNYLIGLFRRAFLVGHAERARTAEVLFLENVRFYDDETGRHRLFRSVQDALGRSGQQWKQVFYAPFAEPLYLKLLLHKHLFDPHPFLGDYLTVKGIRAGKRLVTDLRSLWQKADGDPAFRALFSYRGVDFYPVIRERFVLIMKALAYAAADMEVSARSILAREGYSVLVLDNEENQYGKALMLAAQRQPRRSAVSLSCELVFPGGPQTRSKREAANARGAPEWRPLPERKCVWSAESKQILERGGFPKGVCAVTGNPQLDEAFRPSEGLPALFAKHSLSPRKKHVLVVSTFDHRDLETYVRIARENPGYVWVIKAHPGEDERPILRRLRRGDCPGNLVLRPRTANTLELIRLSFAVMSTWSTVGLEAAVLAKPVILLNLERADMDEKVFVPNREGFEARRVEDVARALAALEDPGRRRAALRRLAAFARKHSFRRDGRAGERAAARIKELIDAQGS